MAWWRSAEGAIGLQTAALFLALLPSEKSPLGVMLWETGYPWFWIVALLGLSVSTILSFCYDVPIIQPIVMFLGMVLWVALSLLLFQTGLRSLGAIGVANVLLYLGAFYSALIAFIGRR
jgi:hypothetical protein